MRKNVFKICVLFLFFHLVISPSVVLTVSKDVLSAEECNLISNIPYWYPQGGTYVESGLYVTCYSSSFAGYSLSYDESASFNEDVMVLRCYDSATDSFIWEKFIDGCGHANAICFCPDDRKLYVANYNVISVIDWDNLDDDIVEKIKSPASGNAFGIAYDRENKLFYTSNTGVYNNPITLLSYNGVFESVKEEIKINDFMSTHSTQGLHYVLDGIAYIIYYEPTKIVAGFDITSGNLMLAYSMPDVIGDDYNVVELEAITYNPDNQIFVVQDAYGWIECPFLKNAEHKIIKNQEITATTNYNLLTKIPQIWALCGCYLEDGKYAIGYVSTAGDLLMLRCYDSKADVSKAWGKPIIIDGAGYANSICFRPQDRKLYIADSYTYAESGGSGKRL